MAFLEAEVKSAEISLGNYAKVVILRISSVGKILPIWISEPSFESIRIALDGIQLPRPNTHDFMLNTVNSFGYPLKAVVIINFENETYFARAIFESNDTKHDIDCMPSDAIALAIRAKVPIYIAEELLEYAYNEDE